MAASAPRRARRLSRAVAARGRSERRLWPAAGVLAGAAIALVVAAAGIIGSSAPLPLPPSDAASELELSAADAAASGAGAPVSSAEKDADPLLTATPDPHSEAGGLVAGFPSTLIPLPPDAVILVTSAAPVGNADVQEVSLNLHTTMTTTQVVQLYRTALTTAGFTEVDSTNSSLDADASFTRAGGDELVVLGVLDDGTSRTVTIGGRVRDAG